MSELATGWLSRGESIALGWTLLHFCWQGIAVAFVFAFVDRLTMRAGSAVRYGVAAGSLALMPLLVMATFAHEMQIAAPTDIQSPIGPQTWAMPENAGAQQAAQQLDIPLGLPVQKQVARIADATERFLPWLDAVWMAGVLLLAVRALGGWRQLERLRRRANGILPSSVEHSFQLACARVRVGRKVALRISDQVISPMAMGVWQATVILPLSAVLHLSAAEMQAVLAHELGHIRRWDYAWNLLQTAMETALFFHPAVWWLSRKVRDRREVCCDEIAVQSCSDPIVYAQTLLRLEEQKVASVRLAVAQRGSGGSLLGRIRKVLGEDEPMENGITGSMRVAVAGLIVFGLLLGPRMSHAVVESLPAANATPATSLDALTGNDLKDSDVATVSAVSAGAAKASIQSATTTEQAEPTTAAALSAKSDASLASGVEIAQNDAKADSKHVSYIDGMREAGYSLDLNNDFNTLVSLKSLGVTPEYAKQMASLGFGKPSVHELLSLKALGVTPEYVSELKQSGLGPKDFHEVTTEKALGITPEYAAAMKKTEFGDLKLQDLISLKAQGVTPEYVGWLKQQFPQITIEELKRAAVFHLDDKFLAEAKSHGFDGKDLDKLLRLKMSGLLDE